MVAVLSPPQSKKLLLDVQREQAVFQFVPTVSSPVIGHHWGEPGSLLFSPSLPVFACIDEIPLSLLCSGLTSPVSLGFFSRTQHPNPFICFELHEVLVQHICPAFRDPSGWQQNSPECQPPSGWEECWGYTLSHHPEMKHFSLKKFHPIPYPEKKPSNVEINVGINAFARREKIVGQN